MDILDRREFLKEEVDSAVKVCARKRHDNRASQVSTIGSLPETGNLHGTSHTERVTCDRINPDDFAVDPDILAV